MKIETNSRIKTSYGKCVENEMNDINDPNSELEVVSFVILIFPVAVSLSTYLFATTSLVHINDFCPNWELIVQWYIWRRSSLISKHSPSSVRSDFLFYPLSLLFYHWETRFTAAPVHIFSACLPNHEADLFPLGGPNFCVTSWHFWFAWIYSCCRSEKK